MKHTTECSRAFRKSGLLNRFDCICTCYTQIFKSSLVQSIRKTSANIEKIASYEWEDMENQDLEHVF